MSSTRKVLCVFSEEQEPELRAALRALPPGVEVSWRQDGEAALAEVASLRPDLVMVGMEVGPMEGLEFLALLLRANPGSTCPVMVVPSPGDPFPPVIHKRDPASGRSQAVELERGVDLSKAVLDALGPLPAAAPAAPVVAPTAAPASAAPIAPPISAAPARRSRMPLLLGVAAVLVLGGGAAALLWPRGPEPAPKVSTVGPDLGASAGTGSGSAVPSRPERPDAAPKAAPKAEPPASPERLPEKLVLPVRFDRGSSEPTVADEASLAKIVAAVKAEEARFEVAGHTSNEGSDEFNQRLGLARARAVVKLLVARGVGAGRLDARSYAGREPLADNQSEEGRARNRRVSLRRLP